MKTVCFFFHIYKKKTHKNRIVNTINTKMLKTIKLVIPNYAEIKLLFWVSLYSACKSSFYFG